MRGGPPPAALGNRAAPAPAPNRPGPGVSPSERVEFDDFYAGLYPHGRWVNTPEHGMVFVPGSHIQVSGWRPYLHGQWVWTSYGWTWVSDEPFGWATYHYGRWSYASAWGWYWVPGYVWGPAWVAWRYGPDSIGWAPLYPGYVSIGVSYPVHVDHWVFIGHRHFHGYPVHRHWVRGQVHHHFHRSHWASNWRSSGRVYAGPPRRWVEARHGRGRIVETRIVHRERPSVSRVVASQGRREVQVYRPGVAGTIRPERRPLPSSVQLRNGRPSTGSGLVREAPARRETPARREVRPSTQRQGTPPSLRQGQGQGQGQGPRPAQRREAPPPGQRPTQRQVSPQQGQRPAERPTQRQAPPQQGQRPAQRPTQRQAPPQQGQRPAQRPAQRQVTPQQGQRPTQRQMMSPPAAQRPAPQQQAAPRPQSSQRQVNPPAAQRPAQRQMNPPAAQRPAQRQVAPRSQPSQRRQEAGSSIRSTQRSSQQNRSVGGRTPAAPRPAPSRSGG